MERPTVVCVRCGSKYRIVTYRRRKLSAAQAPGERAILLPVPEHECSVCAGGEERGRNERRQDS